MELVLLSAHSFCIFLISDKNNGEKLNVEQIIMNNEQIIKHSSTYI
jgi:hypothetical protein